MKSKALTPLRLAFFGSDAFSVTSLARLNTLRLENPELIAQLDVITRSIKPTGRNLKTFVDVPVGQFASSQNLPVWRADSGKDILNISSRYDLAVAVSYGRLIPGEFLSRTTFGGINVHPSLLPQYSGSSPIQYALMDDQKTTGVTVQTLHPTKFDHGAIIEQSGPIVIEEEDNFLLLLQRLAGVGADLLENVIVSRKYIDPLEVKSSQHYSLASKISPKKYQIDWQKQTSRQIRRASDALGALHTYKMVDIVKKKKRVHELYKVILEDIREVNNPTCVTLPGQFELGDRKMLIKTLDGVVSVGKLKFQYCGFESPETFMKLLPKRAGDTGQFFELQD